MPITTGLKVFNRDHLR